MDLLKKTYWKLSETLILASFLLKGISNSTIAHEFSKRSKFSVFFGKNRWFYSKKICKFSKSLNMDTYFRERFLSYSCLCNLKEFKSSDFLEIMIFFSKKSLRVFSSTMLGIFYLEGASDFEIAWEFSKQSIFFGFFGEIDVVFEMILDFFRNRKTSYLFSSLRLK